MANIDLYQSIQEEKNSTDKKGLMDKGMAVVILVLVVTFATWGGLKFYNVFLNKKLGNLDSQITEESNKIEALKTDRIANFQERMNIIKKNIPSRGDPSEFFGNLEKVMVQGVVLDSCSFGYDDKEKGKTATLTAITDNFTLVAQQILNFKKISYFSDVALGNVQRDQEGKIKFIINAKFGNPIK